MEARINHAYNFSLQEHSESATNAISNRFTSYNTQKSLATMNRIFGKELVKNPCRLGLIMYAIVPRRSTANQ
jgi:hypothetical protein